MTHYCLGFFSPDMTSISVPSSTLLDSGKPVFYPTHPFLQIGSSHRNSTHITTIRSNFSRKTTMRVSNTTITTGDLESKEINEKVKMVGIVGEDSVSPLNSASWYDVMLHTVSSPFFSFYYTHTYKYLSA